MNNINLCSILQNCPDTYRFYYSIIGDYVIIDTIGKNSIKLRLPDKHLSESISYINTHGALCPNGECMLWPDKNDHDWEKWQKLHTSEYKIKTWIDLCNSGLISCNGVSINANGDVFIEFNSKSEMAAAALLQIIQLINSCYGGYPTFNEKLGSNKLYEIYYDDRENRYIVDECALATSFVTFYTKENAYEFLKYYENIKLLDQLYMR